MLDISHRLPEIIRLTYSSYLRLFSLENSLVINCHDYPRLIRLSKKYLLIIAECYVVRTFEVHSRQGVAFQTREYPVSSLISSTQFDIFGVSILRRTVFLNARGKVWNVFTRTTIISALAVAIDKNEIIWIRSTE